jgi:GntR family transcriptional regulator
MNYGTISMIHFRLEPGSAMPVYAQLTRQVRSAVLRGVLVPGDRLPAAREVVSSLAINPNTVLKAYSQLEHEGVVFSRVGQGTFIAETAPAPISASVRHGLAPALRTWMTRARVAGLSEEAVFALFESTVDDAYRAGAA